MLIIISGCPLYDRKINTAILYSWFILKNAGLSFNVFRAFKTAFWTSKLLRNEKISSIRAREKEWRGGQIKLSIPSFLCYYFSHLQACRILQSEKTQRCLT